MAGKTKIAIAASGKGRSLENFLKVDGKFEVAAVICSNSKAGAVDIAKARDIPLYAFDAKNLDSEDLEAWLRRLRIEWIVLAGFLKAFPTLGSFANRTINIHPALLPRFGGHGMYGNRVHEAVLSSHEKVSGATVHFVNERYDEGAIIAQGQVAIEGLKTPEEIALKVFELECLLYPCVLDKLIDHELPLKNGRTWLYGDETC